MVLLYIAGVRGKRWELNVKVLKRTRYTKETGVLCVGW